MKTEKSWTWTTWFIVLLIAAGMLAFAMARSPDVLVIGLGLIISLPFWGWAVYLSAKSDRQFTFRKSGEIKFAKTGEVVDTVIAHVPGYYYDKENDLMVKIDDGADPLSNQENWFSRFIKNIASLFVKDASKEPSSLVLVSPFYPYRRIHSWKFTRTKFVPKTHSESEHQHIFDKFLVQSVSEEGIRSIYPQHIYPIVAEEIDLKGIQIKVMIQIELFARRPIHLITTYKGNFVLNVQGEIKGMVDNKIGRGAMTIDDWMVADREAIIDDLFKPGDLILGGDMMVLGTSYVAFDFDGPNADKNRELARQKERIRIETEGRILAAENAAVEAKHRAEQEVTEAEGEAKAAKYKAKGMMAISKAKAEEVRMTLEEASKHSQGVELLIARERTAAVAEFGGSTLILDSSRSGVMVSAEAGRPAEDKGKAPKNERKEVSS